eukprot:TRINITY_DN4853_c0_g1_i4.p1 TRINITY_DN4853_c0_g1~~TRINITY_DN4853_c0_g1_i4.p1  ORF type:complete len:303 (-),score=62.41 TRINITY_DN4853_c0_g1_i4:72-980(-)
MHPFLRSVISKRILSSTNRLFPCSRFVASTPIYNPFISLSHYSTSNSSQSHPSIHTASAHIGDPLFCWKCSKKVPHQGFFCPSCEVVQPAHEPTETPHDHTHHHNHTHNHNEHPTTTTNADTNPSIPYYFSIFGLPFKFDIDPEMLASTFKKLQRKLHPDLYTLKSPNEQKFSEQQSIAINNAYKVLKDPYTRAQYMLQQIGVVLNEGTVVFQEGNESNVQGVADNGLLMEIMELREAVEESPPEDLKKIAEENKAKINNLVKEISNLFETKDFHEALSKTIRLRYYNRLQEELGEKLGKHI